MYLLSPPLLTLCTYSTHHVSLVTTPLHLRYTQHTSCISCHHPSYRGYIQHTSCISCHHPSLPWVHTARIMYLLSPPLSTLGKHSTHHVSLVTPQHNTTNNKQTWHCLLTRIFRSRCWLISGSCWETIVKHFSPYVNKVVS